MNMTKKSETEIIHNYKEFVNRKFEVGFSYSQIYLMAYSYLDCLCENGLIDCDKHSVLLSYVPFLDLRSKGDSGC